MYSPLSSTAAALRANHPHQQRRVVASSGAKEQYDVSYYLKAGVAGAICCSLTHGAVTPIGERGAARGRALVKLTPPQTSSRRASSWTRPSTTRAS